MSSVSNNQSVLSNKRKRSDLEDEIDPFHSTLEIVDSFTKDRFKKVFKGNNGAQILMDSSDKPIAIFKKTSSRNDLSMVERLKTFVGQKRLLNQVDPHAESFNEYVGFKFSEYFNFHLAPAAKFITILSQTGSLIQFLDGFDEMAVHKVRFCTKKTYDKNEIELWQLLSLFNFLIGNIDPHAENLFVKFENGKLIDLKMIDLGHSMIQRNPDFGSFGYQGDWGKYPIANDPFIPSVINFIKTNLTQDRLEAFISDISSERPGYWTPEMKTLLRERFNLVIECVLNDKIKTPFQLSEIHTTYDFNRMLGKGSSSYQIAAETFNWALNAKSGSLGSFFQ